MPTKNLKSNFAKFLVASAGAISLFALAKLIEKSKLNKKKKQISNESLQKELDEFVRLSGTNLDDLDTDKFQSDFLQYLKDKNYDLAGVGASVVPVESPGDDDEEDVLSSLKNVHKITEDLNKYVHKLTVFVDTTKMMPGLVCYAIEKVAPNDKKPYVTYRSTPRVISQIHDNGVNGGTIFFTYNHKVEKNQSFTGSSYTTSEDQAIYSPLTKEHADYICKLLNIQSKQVYEKHMRELAKQKQLELKEKKKKQQQRTK